MKTLLTLCLICFLCLFTVSAVQTTQKWEYKFEYKCNEKKANALAVDGWELVAIESTSTAGPLTNVSTYVFKRARPSQ